MSVIQSDSESLVPAEIAGMRDRYRLLREKSLLDAAAATIAINSIFLSDSIDYGEITPQMREAFELSFPNDVLEDRLADLDVDNAFELAGFMSNWRGKYFEVLVRDDLNAGGQVGDLVLTEGQTAVLAEGISQPGWDLQIVSESGDVATEVQLKATDSVSYIKSALEKYPDIDIVATDEVAEGLIDSALMPSGFDNSELSSDLSAPLDEVIDSPLVDALEAFGAGLPVLLIAGTEGTMVLMGRQDFSTAISRSVERASKTGIAMAAGGAVALLGGGAFSLPATLIARLGIARHDVSNKLDESIRANTATVRGLLNVPPVVNES